MTQISMIRKKTDQNNTRDNTKAKVKKTVNRTVLILAALLYGIFAILPIWWMFNIVFSEPGLPVTLNPRLYPTSLTAGIKTLIDVAREYHFIRSYLVTFAYAFVQIVGTLIVCSLAAYEFALFDFPGKNTLFAIAIASMMIPQAVTTIPLYQTIAKLGWINTIQGLAVPGVASAFFLFVLRQFMEDLPRELIEAAEIDGASHFTIYRKIVMPLSTNALVVVAILSFRLAWGNYLWPLVVATSDKMATVSVTVGHFFGESVWVTIFETMGACLLASIPPIIIYVIFQRYIIQSIAITGLRQ